MWMVPESWWVGAGEFPSASMLGGAEDSHPPAGAEAPPTDHASQTKGEGPTATGERGQSGRQPQDLPFQPGGV